MLSGFSYTVIFPSPINRLLVHDEMLCGSCINNEERLLSESLGGSGTLSGYGGTNNVAEEVNFSSAIRAKPPSRRKLSDRNYEKCKSLQQSI